MFKIQLNPLKIFDIKSDLQGIYFIILCKIYFLTHLVMYHEFFFKKN
jgi:hypothetical protein